jgi:hypothetical protein
MGMRKRLVMVKVAEEVLRVGSALASSNSQG